MTKLLHAELTYYLRGLGFEIHNELGAGHAEEDYETALVFCLEEDGVRFRQQPVYRIDYRGRQVGEYRPDVVLEEGRLLVELKAAPAIERLHKAQTLSYLRVTGSELGLIMNFGGASMQFERLPNFMKERKVSATRQPTPTGLLFAELSQAVLDVLHQVHAVLGPGFLHQVYRRAVRIELAEQRLAAVYLKELPLRFRNHDLSTRPVRLFLVEGKMLLATVAVKQIDASHRQKMRWAMQVTGCKLGLVANFYPTVLACQFLRDG